MTIIMVVGLRRLRSRSNAEEHGRGKRERKRGRGRGERQTWRLKRKADLEVIQARQKT
jgi:hypothetical protein